MKKVLIILAAVTGLAEAQTAPKVVFQRDIVYAAAEDGVALKLDIARPAEVAGPLPAVVCIHGGAWQQGNKSSYSPVLYMLAQAGYVGAAVQYRFAPRNQFPAQIHDIKTAVRYLSRHAAEYGIDPRRIAALGDSAGGHLALLLGLTPQSAFDASNGDGPGTARVRAVVNLSGPTDLSRWKATEAGEKLLAQTSAELLERVFGAAERSSPLLAAASPLTYVNQNSPAVLTFHGGADSVVPPQQSEWLHEALRKAGVEEQLVMFPEAGHGFSPENLKQITATTLAFLNKHVRAAGAPPRIDAHVHIGPPPPVFYRVLDRLNLRLLNVTVVDPHDPPFDTVEPQTTIARDLARGSAGRVAWAATFDPAGFEKPGFVESATAHLQSAFASGAIAVKIYKSIGMDLKTASGKYLMPDDPAFTPVLNMIARSGKPLMAHLAEPLSSWKELDPADPHYGYYKNNPDWHMFRHPERPRWEQIIAARDRMLERHPDLKVIGCHLGSMEHDVDEIAKRLDRYPNFAVDTAARIPNLKRQPNEKVRAFMIRYQNRVLWATDGLEIAWKTPEAVSGWEATLERHWKYFAEDLALPPEVLRKIFHDNAVRWIPGLDRSVAP